MECARLLVERGADVNVLNEGGCYGSSLHYAVFRNDVDFVKYVSSVVTNVKVMLMLAGI